MLFTLSVDLSASFQLQLNLNKHKPNLEPGGAYFLDTNDVYLNVNIDVSVVNVCTCKVGNRCR